MGLPVWRDPEEDQRLKRSAMKRDPSALLRSSIRRRPSIHGRRHITHAVTRFTRSPPPLQLPVVEPPLPPYTANRHRSSRRVAHRGVPPITTLIQSADRRPELRRPTYPPPSLAERRDSDNMEFNIRELRQLSSSLGERVSHIRSSLEQIRSAAAERGSGSRARETRRRSHSPDERRQRRRTEATRRERRSSVDRGMDAAPPAAAPSPSSMSSEDEGFVAASSEDIRQMRERFFRNRHLLSMDGLGDRNRSPTPADTDGWEIIRTTMMPDAVLPSTDSSLTTAAATNSILRSNATSITEPDLQEGLQGVPENLADDPQDDTASSIDVEYLVCDEYDMATTASFAEDMYFLEMSDLEGRERIACHQQTVAVEGRAYALGNEPDRVEIGFRLLNSALDSAGGRARVRSLARARQAEINSHDNYDRRGLGAASPSAASPPPPALHADPTLSEDEQERDLVRRIVERLAARAEVPEEWWMSLGLDLPRSQVRPDSRDPDRSPRRDSERSRLHEGPRL